MDDMKKDPFAEYIRQAGPGREKLANAWHTAIGLQAVDRLETSEYLHKTARDNIDGKISIAEANKLISDYYAVSPKHDKVRTREADLVSARIAAILSEGAFVFSVPQYRAIHGRLFEGIYDHAGKVRDFNISKKEWVLNGESVIYGNADNLMKLLAYDIQTEKSYKYPFSNIYAIIPHLASFVSNLWQIHVFAEGNTRTTAVFFIKYLRSMGFQAANDIFAENAWYFRNALVRANYTDWNRGIQSTTVYLELFLKNLLAGENNELKNRYLHIHWKDEKGASEADLHDSFENPDLGYRNEKQDIEASKQDIGRQKQDIEIPDHFQPKTKRSILALFERFGYDQFFGRTRVMEVLNITASPASELLGKMLSAGVIISVSGHGKGKYRFTKSG